MKLRIYCLIGVAALVSCENNDEEASRQYEEKLAEIQEWRDRNAKEQMENNFTDEREDEGEIDFLVDFERKELDRLKTETEKRLSQIHKEILKTIRRISDEETAELKRELKMLVIDNNLDLTIEEKRELKLKIHKESIAANTKFKVSRMSGTIKLLEAEKEFLIARRDKALAKSKAEKPDATAAESAEYSHVLQKLEVAEQNLKRLRRFKWSDE